MPTRLTRVILIFLLTGCSTEPNESKTIHPERIERKADEILYPETEYIPISRSPYPWEETTLHQFPKITKDYFRCNGNSLNPPRIIRHNGQTIHLDDCGGLDAHGLPVSDGNEWIPAILIELLNYLQDETGKKVVITCGHRCPKHHQYVFQTPYAKPSKHLMGAEVNFYIQGLESQPQTIVSFIQQFYKETEYSTFDRYEKSDTDVSTKPWYNKEIFIKLYQKHEGRNFDNRHPYPYLAIQVRYDREKDERLVFDWEKAEKGFIRH